MAPTTEELVAQLTGHGAFYKVDTSEIRTLVETSEYRVLVPGEALWAPGQSRENAYVLLGGQIDHTLAVGDRDVEHYRNPGVILSISSLIEAWAYHSSAVAVVRSEVLVLSRARFEALFEARDPVAFRLVDQIADYLVYDVHRANERLQSVFGRPEETLMMLRRRVRDETKA